MVPSVMGANSCAGGAFLALAARPVDEKMAVPARNVFARKKKSSSLLRSKGGGKKKKKIERIHIFNAMGMPEHRTMAECVLSAYLSMIYEL